MVQKPHLVGNFRCNMLAICHYLFQAILARACIQQGLSFFFFFLFFCTLPDCSFCLWLGSFPYFELSLSIWFCRLPCLPVSFPLASLTTTTKFASEGNTIFGDPQSWNSGAGSPSCHYHRLSEGGQRSEGRNRLSP